MFEFMYDLKRGSETTRLELFENGFFPVSEEDIRGAEAALHHPLPSELRTFYTEVGEGQLQTGLDGTHADYNHILSPKELVRVLNGKSDWLMPYSELQPNVLPFFVRDTDLFLCLHPTSDAPNAVWWMWGEKICDSLVDFFAKLHRNPNWFSLPKLH